jgi:hypothetical protein
LAGFGEVQRRKMCLHIFQANGGAKSAIQRMERYLRIFAPAKIAGSDPTSGPKLNTHRRMGI